MFLHVTILSIDKDLYNRKIYEREREREKERREREINFKNDEIFKSLYCTTPILFKGKRSKSPVFF